MCGMAREFGDPVRSWPSMLEAADRSGMPVDARLWLAGAAAELISRRASPSRRRPEQGDPGPYLRRAARGPDVPPAQARLDRRAARGGPRGAGAGPRSAPAGVRVARDRRGVRCRSRPLPAPCRPSTARRAATASSCPRSSSSAPTVRSTGCTARPTTRRLRRGGDRRGGVAGSPGPRWRLRMRCAGFGSMATAEVAARLRPARAAGAGRAVAAGHRVARPARAGRQRLPLVAGLRAGGGRSASRARSGRARRAAASCRARGPGSAASRRASRRTPRRRRRRTAPRLRPAARGGGAAPPSAGWRRRSPAARRGARGGWRPRGVKRRIRAAASVAPLRETPGISEHACATPSHSASTAPGLLECVRSWGERSASAIASAPASSPAATVGGRAEMALDRALEPVADRPPAGRTTARSAAPGARFRPADGFVDLAAEADQQRGGRAGVERHLERLAQLVVEPAVVPAGQPRDHRDVSRGGDREQLRRPVQRAEADACQTGRVWADAERPGRR